MSEQANVELILSIYDMFRRGEIPAILENLDPDSSFETEAPPSVPYAGVHHGRDGAGRFFAGVATMDEIQLEMTPFAAQGDNVVTSGRYRARIRATGRRIDVPLVHLWTIRNGKVVRFQNLSNTAAIAEAYGSAAAGAR